MSGDCCFLVGNFTKLNGLTGVISVSINSSTESSLIEESLVIGQTIGTLSISAYATKSIHLECPGRAGVQIPWVRKWDCDNNVSYFIPSGAGKSFVSGDVAGLASVYRTLGYYNVVNASSSSGPASLYTDDTQEDGYGLSYRGDPIPVPDSVGFSYSFEGLGIGEQSDFYLQSLNLECNPGSIPTVSYSFVFIGQFE